MPRFYPSEYRHRVIDLIKSGMSMAEVAERLGVTAAAIYNWWNQHLLQQRHHQILLCATPGRGPQPETLADPNRVGQRHLRIPRDLPQPPTPSLSDRNDHPDRI